MKTEEIVRELRYPVGRCRNLEELMATSADRLEFLERALKEARLRLWTGYWNKGGMDAWDEWLKTQPPIIEEHNASTVPVGDGT